VITGFTDASIYNNRGIEMAVVGIGAQNEHSTEESIAVADMEKAARALVEMLRLSAL
jgi:di/tripeptidase